MADVSLGAAGASRVEVEQAVLDRNTVQVNGCENDAILWAYFHNSSIGRYNPAPPKGTYSNPRPNGSSYLTVVQSMPIAE